MTEDIIILAVAVVIGGLTFLAAHRKFGGDCIP